MKIWKIDTQNYQEAETNNSGLGNDHNIIVADAESIPNQVEENINNFTGKNSFSARPRSKWNQSKKDLELAIYLVSVCYQVLLCDKYNFVSQINSLKILGKNLKFTTISQPSPGKIVPR